MNVQEVKLFGDVVGFRLGSAPIGLPLMSVYCYYLDGVLIDTASRNVRNLLVNVTQDRIISQVILTHFHEDHSGNAAFFKNRNVPVYASRKTVEKLRKKIPLRPYEIYMWGRIEPVEALILPPTIETNNFTLEHFETPGHSDDHVIYYERKRGWIFTGDMFLAPRIKYFRRDEDLFQTQLSLKKILSLDFEFMFCGHNPQFRDAHKMLNRKYEFLVTIHRKVENLISQGLSKKEILSVMVANNGTYLARMFTLGDVSYKNLILSAIGSVNRGNRASF